jgi:uncharacterized membrane protein
MFKKILKFLRDNFIAGIIVILPVTFTVFIIRFFVISLNSLMLNPLTKGLRSYPLYEDQRMFLAKTVVFLAVVLLIVLVGLMTRIIIIRKFFGFFERILLRLPMVNKIYSSIKEISSAVLGKRKSEFKKVVLVEYPRKGLYAIGFVTSDSKGSFQEALGDPDVISIYVPTTPNPTSGYFVLLNKREVMPLDISVEEALRVVISAGVVAPSSLKHKKITDS